MLSQPQVQSAAGRIMSMKNSSDTIENQARDLRNLIKGMEIFST